MPVNTSADITSITTSVCSSLRMMVASTSALPVALFVQRRVLHQGGLVGPALVADVVLHGPYRQLEMQRQQGVVVHRQVAGLLQQLGALVVVHGRGGFAHQLVHFRIRIAAAVGGAFARV